MILSPDFKDFFASLNGPRVSYRVVGGYAVALHGHPRYTKDIDVWIGSDEENAKRLVQAIENFGFGSLALTAEDFLVPDRIVQLGYPPNRIDLIITLPGVAFEECYPSGVKVTPLVPAGPSSGREKRSRSTRWLTERWTLPCPVS
jgi:hypothetical protein